MSDILIINGPNLNLLALREKEIYGAKSFDDFFAELSERYKELNLSAFQSNIEGEIIDQLHKAIGTCEMVILNAGGYTHTSVAIADAVALLKSQNLPVVEVHISNIMAREEFRHTSLIAPNCAGTIAGFGLESYALALEYYKNIKRK